MEKFSLAAIRVNKRMSVEEMANALGISADRLRRLENGETKMLAEELIEFHRITGAEYDVIDLNPRVVVIMAGINDIALNNGKITHENIMGNIISMCELAKLHKIKVILCSVTPAYSFRWRPNVDFVPADEIIRLNKMIKGYADSHKIPYVDFHSALVDERKGMNRKYHKDEVHPNPLCYAEVLEPMILPVINKTIRTKHTYTTPIPKK